VKRRRRVVGLEPSRREMRFLRFVPTPVLDFSTRRDINARSLEALGSWANDNSLLLLPPSSLAGIFRVQKVRPPDFISVGHRQERTARNIPELGLGQK